jgi:folylpolyglutamate synthase/dihydropteroate synthase
VDAEAATSVEAALELAAQQGTGGVVVVSGSVYLVGAVRSVLFGGGGRQP